MEIFRRRKEDRLTILDRLRDIVETKEQVVCVVFIAWCDGQYKLFWTPEAAQRCVDKLGNGWVEEVKVWS